MKFKEAPNNLKLANNLTGNTFYKGLQIIDENFDSVDSGFLLISRFFKSIVFESIQKVNEHKISEFIKINHSSICLKGCYLFGIKHKNEFVFGVGVHMDKITDYHKNNYQIIDIKHKKIIE